MKKTKVLLILILTILTISMVNGNVNAHTVELDPNDFISFPTSTYGGEGTIYISGLVQTGYSLYYQAVEMSSASYAEYKHIKSAGEENLKLIEYEINQIIDIELKELKEIYDEKLAAYESKLESGATEEEAIVEREAYETALTNYNNKVTEYNDKINEYNTKLKEINDNMKELIPMYVESNWTKTEDRTFEYDTSWFSDEKVVAMWAKLVTADGKIHYDQVIYVLTGTKVNVESVSLNKTEISIVEGEKYTLVATVNPSNAMNKTIEWTSDNDNVATVADGKVTAVSAGTAKITAKTVDGGYTAICQVTVTPKEEEKIAVNSVSLNKTEISIEAGKNYTLVATVNPSNADNKTVTWSSDNTSIVTVVDGKVTAVSAGIANITVKTIEGNHTATCKITVTSSTTPDSGESGTEGDETDTIEWTDFSNAVFEWKKNYDYNRHADLSIKNVNFRDERGYYVYFSHNKAEKFDIEDFDSVDDSIWKNTISKNESLIKFIYDELDDMVATNGDIYLWVCEVDYITDKAKIVVNAQEINRISAMPLGTRINAFFFDDSTSIFCYEEYGSLNRKVNVKIGKVTDKNILESIKNGEADCLQKLLNYSKAAESIYAGTVNLDDDKAIASSINLVNEAYYYVYMELEDEDGKYYPIEDISLYQAQVSSESGKNLFNYLDDNFVWNLEEDKTSDTSKPEPTPEPEKDDTTASGKIPQTGAEIWIALLIISVLASGVFAYYRYNIFRDI